MIRKLRFLFWGLLLFPWVLMAQSSQPIKPGKICLDGNRLYVVVPGWGVRVFDIKNLAAVREIRFIRVDGIVDIAVHGEYLYANQYRDLVLLKVPLDPAVEPVEVKRNRDVFENIPHGADPKMIAGFSSWDDQPLFGGPAPGFAQNGSMSCFALAGNCFYAVDDEKLITFHARPTAANLLEKIDVDLTGKVLETVFTDGESRLYLGSQLGMDIYDNSNRENPALLGTYKHARSCDPVVVQGDFAYLTMRDGRDCAGNVNQLEIIDISRPSTPRRVMAHQLTNPHGLAILENLLIVCDGTDGLRAFQISPERRKIIETAHLKNFTAYDVLYNAEKKAAIISTPGKTLIYSFLNPSAPIQLSSIDLTSTP